VTPAALLNPDQYLAALLHCNMSCLQIVQLLLLLLLILLIQPRVLLLLHVNLLMWPSPLSVGEPPRQL
jgi:hypothetical protein